MAVEESMAMESAERASVESVRKSVNVHATPERAFKVFTEEMDSWWPKSHHIGKSPMKAIVVEGREGGTIYTAQEDGTDCPWGSVKVWDPPRRFVMLWHVRPDWQYERDPANCSEVELTFTPVDDGTTLVELEHRNFERHGGEYAKMRDTVDAEGGWGGLLALFTAEADKAAGA
jgi:Activator of Hsp90 ATPase homolog 1-like protein